jgi:2-methylisocitrate lyase-like PEP mutase family enzyme
MTTQSEKANNFLKLHRSDRVLVLPNAWDVPSARIFEDCGFPAIATSSGGVSASLGYPDGEFISRAEMLGAVGRIAKAISVPLSADIETGFANNIEEIEELTKALISTGAIGLNIEDATRGNKDRPLFTFEEQIEKIKAIRRVSHSVGIPLVINARTDAFRYTKEIDRLEETIARGNAYAGAGADCVFTFGVKDPTTIRAVVEKIQSPINIRAGLGTPTISELQSLGVARASLATGPVCSVLGHLKRIAEEIKERGTYRTLTEGAITHDELNKLAVHR